MELLLLVLRKEGKVSYCELDVCEFSLWKSKREEFGTWIEIVILLPAIRDPITVSLFLITVKQ
jgi:hypothetical protein